MVKTCWSCGLNILDEARFCSWCGVKNDVVMAMPAASATVPVAAPVVNMPVLVPSVSPVPAVQTINLVEKGHRRLSFCNKCGVNIPFGESRTYMGSVMCPDCAEIEHIPTRTAQTVAYAAIF